MKAVSGIEKLDVKNTNTEWLGFSTDNESLNLIKLPKTTKSMTGIKDLSEVNINIKDIMGYGNLKEFVQKEVI